MSKSEQEVSAAGTAPECVGLDARTAGTSGVVIVKTWECKPCGMLIAQGDPCPKCGKQLLLG